jgi:hypothetical protein
VPTCKLLAVAFGALLLKLAVLGPEICDHAPVPVAAGTAFKPTEVTAQALMSIPALAGVETTKFIKSLEVGQAPVTCHCNT